MKVYGGNNDTESGQAYIWTNKKINEEKKMIPIKMPVIPFQLIV